jgi:hypothetical protein
MAVARNIKVELTGPAVAEWLATHLQSRGAKEPDATNTGPLGAYSAYEGRAEWSLPFHEADDEQSWRLIAHAVKVFATVVPDGKELLDKHKSGVRIIVTGGPR